MFFIFENENDYKNYFYFHYYQGLMFYVIIVLGLLG